jgi:hypothetical protein
LIQVVHQLDLCCCGQSQGLDPVNCTCEPETRLHELPDQAADAIEPVLLRRLLKAQEREVQP